MTDQEKFIETLIEKLKFLTLDVQIAEAKANYATELLIKIIDCLPIEEQGKCNRILHEVTQKAALGGDAAYIAMADALDFIKDNTVREEREAHNVKSESKRRKERLGEHIQQTLKFEFSDDG